MIIALKDKDSVYVAASIEGTYTAFHVDDILSQDNLKLWRSFFDDKTLIASLSAGSPGVDNVRYTDFDALKKPLNNDIIIREFIPALKDVFTQRNILDSGELWHDFLIARDDRAFVITPKFEVCEVEDFEAVGRSDSEDVAFGYLQMSKEFDPIDRIVGAFKLVEESEGRRHFPIVIMNTTTQDRIVMGKGDESEI